MVVACPQLWVGGVLEECCAGHLGFVWCKLPCGQWSMWLGCKQGKESTECLLQTQCTVVELLVDAFLHWNILLNQSSFCLFSVLLQFLVHPDPPGDYCKLSRHLYRTDEKNHWIVYWLDITPKKNIKQPVNLYLMLLWFFRSSRKSSAKFPWQLQPRIILPGHANFIPVTIFICWASYMKEFSFVHNFLDTSKGVLSLLDVPIPADTLPGQLLVNMRTNTIGSQAFLMVHALH